jgi:CRP-like cAMP-binding protein
MLQLVSGWIAQARISRDGRRQITSLLLPDDFCDPSWVCNRTNLQTVTALTPVTVQKTPIERLDSDVVPAEYALALVRAVRIQTEWIIDLGRKSAISRLAHLICEIAMRLNLCVRGKICFDLPLTQVDLADICGLTAVHVNRTLQEMRASNLITIGQKQVEIVDYDRLVEIGEFDGRYLDNVGIKAAFGDRKNVA